MQVQLQAHAPQSNTHRTALHPIFLEEEGKGKEKEKEWNKKKGKGGTKRQAHPSQPTSPAQPIA